MKKIKILLLASATAIITACVAFLFIHLASKSKYDEARDTYLQGLGEGFQTIEMDKSKLEEIMLWHVQHRDVGDEGVMAEALKTLDKDRTVENVVDLLNYQMQPYAWLNAERNTENLEVAAVQAIVLPVSVDGKIYVSRDWSTAFIIHSDGLATVFTDTDEGLVDELRRREKPEHSTTGNGEETPLDQP